TGTYSCTAGFSAGFSTSENRTAVNIQAAGSPTPAQAAISFPGEAHTGTFTQADTGAKAALYAASGTNFWSAAVGSTTASDNQGSYSMNLTSVSTLASTSSGKAYTVHGTVDGTLLPVSGSGASGNVTFHATF